MGWHRWSVCGAGLHDLTDPANVGTYTRASGRTGRYCKPCALRRARGYHHRRQPAQPVRRPPRRAALGILQAVADGDTTAEVAEALGLTRDAVRLCLYRMRLRYGAETTAATVLAALTAKDIRPVKDQPLPPHSDVTHRHARSLLRLLKGERGPLKPSSREHERMMDDLYAWHEAHAVSVLVAARIITAIPSMKKEAA